MTHTPPGAWPKPGPEYLAGARFIDSDNPAIRRFAQEVVAGASSDIEKAVRLFYRVRDGWRYDPFTMSLDPAPYVASNVLQAKAAFCLPKAVLLAAAARAAGIPAAIGLSDVENHLTTEKLKARMGGKTTFINHGYAVMRLGDKWVKAAPAFNIEMCQRFHVRPTEFDGSNHAIFQEYDARDRRHMEYLRDHGCWSDFPFERVRQEYADFYPAGCFVGHDAGERFEDGSRIH
ncbi:MAG TPA: transglutaminase domain-containing protein [Candidatus Desulfobacillus sp.]|nr:transglutaminase domain-containing protein [Candidatus Desulfobacillus sp.]